MTTETIRVRCCISGGGPAGMMLGFLLARAGVDVLVLEKHADFLRDFRGDTIHPSTLELMKELGLLEKFLGRPHQKATRLTAVVAGEEVVIGDFSHLPTACRFVAFMPQWDFLDFIDGEASKYRTFRLQQEAEVTDLIEEGGRVVGLRAKTPKGNLEVRADLVVGADGRRSTVRARGGLAVDDIGAPMDVLWLRLPRESTDRKNVFGRFENGKIFIMLDRGDYWQCAFVIPKGGNDVVKARGLEAFRADIVQMDEMLKDRVSSLTSWDDVKLLTVTVDRARRWSRPGLLLIGDAAHAMSPVAGVGINLAIQDAVAAANLLAAPLRDGTLTPELVDKVQERREPPTRRTQGLQLMIQKRVIAPVLGGRKTLRTPWPLKLLGWFPVLRRFPARVIGVGFRPEHVRTPDTQALR